MTTATYDYGASDLNAPRQRNGRLAIKRHTMRVEVLEAGADRVRVKFLEWHVDGRGPGTVTTVARRNVKVNGLPIYLSHGFPPFVRRPYEPN